MKPDGFNTEPQVPGKYLEEPISTVGYTMGSSKYLPQSGKPPAQSGNKGKDILQMDEQCSKGFCRHWKGGPATCTWPLGKFHVLW